jgi:hypothetical protein
MNQRVTRAKNGFSFEILQIPDSNKTSFIAHCIEAMALFVSIEAHLIDLELIDAIGGREAKLFWLWCLGLFEWNR